MPRRKDREPSHATDDDRPEPVSGVTDESLRVPRREVTMPAARINPYRSVVDASAEAGLDVDAVTAVLDSHAEVGRVRLRILLADGSVFFESTPPEPRAGKEHEVLVRFPQQEKLTLRGALPARQLEMIAAVLERAVQARASSGAQAQALDAERQRLSLIFDFSERVCKLAAVDEIVGRFLGDIARILGAHEATFFGLDTRRQELYIRCHHGGRPEAVQGFRLKVGEGIAGGVAQDGLPRIVNDVQGCPDYVAKSNPIRNIISAPVHVRGRLVGVVNVNDREGGQRPFSNRDLQLLVSLARLGGVALENVRLYSEIRALLLATIESLTTAIDAKDDFALGHSRRVAFLCSELGRRLGLDDQALDMLQVAAMLHDIGNLGIPESILHKQGPLNHRERAAIKEHPALGASILRPVEQLAEVLPGVLDHHERYDGKGYPRHLKGQEISLQGRLIALADTYDAMTHERPFRRACAAGEALSEITAESGAQFDPALVTVFVECYRALELEHTPLERHLPELRPELDF